MYGLILEPIKQFILEALGEDAWIWLCKKVLGKEPIIDFHKIYPESLIPQMVTTLCDEYKLNIDEILFANGRYAIQYLVKNGYRKLLGVLGRTFKEFLYNINDHHEYLRFTYHQIRPPCFIVSSSTPTTIQLKYSSKRPGYEEYVRGLLIEVAEYYYQLDLSVIILSQTQQGSLVHTMFNLSLPDNMEFEENRSRQTHTTNQIYTFPAISRNTMFNLNPFHLLLNQDMIILSAGNGICRYRANLVGCQFGQIFSINRPFVRSEFEQIKVFRFCTFKLVVKSQSKLPNDSMTLKGEMVFIEEWNMLLFLGKPNIRNVKRLYELGLRIHDLTLYDGTQDAVLAGDDPSDELLMLLEKQVEESKQLAKTTKKLNQLRHQANSLLYQCLPKQVAKLISQGVPPLDTIQNFNNVTICFTKVVHFSNFCTRLTAHQIVQLLNQMYTLYDALSEAHNVYKVETVNDSYMLVSGAPSETPFHSAHIIEIALDILQSTQQSLFWPIEIFKTKNGSLDQEPHPLQLHIGSHTGMIVAGIVGFKTPRYCLFGDTVNTSSRMMTFSLPDTIHVSEKLAKELEPYPYEVECRGEMEIKGKGRMTTYFVKGRKSEFIYFNSKTNENEDFAKILKQDRDQTKQSISESSEPDSEDNSCCSEHDNSSSDQKQTKELDNESQVERRRKSYFEDLIEQDEGPISENSGPIPDGYESDLLDENDEDQTKPGPSEFPETDLVGVTILDSSPNESEVDTIAKPNKLAEVNKFRAMIENNMFSPTPPIQLTSPNSAILYQLANPLSLALTEIAIVQPPNPLLYLSEWLVQFSCKNNSHE